MIVSDLSTITCKLRFQRVVFRNLIFLLKPAATHKDPQLVKIEMCSMDMNNVFGVLWKVWWSMKVWLLISITYF